MTEEELKTEITEQVRLAVEAGAPYKARADYLRNVLEGPGVTPVVHYMRYHHRYEDEHWEDNLVSAFHACDHMIDNGNGAPIGVSVGGAMTTWEDWKDDPRRPRDEEWMYLG